MPEAATGQQPQDLYLDLMKRCLTRYGFPETWREHRPDDRGVAGRVQRKGIGWLQRRGYAVVRPTETDLEARAIGADRPADAETMIGLRRLENLQQCVVDVLRRDVPGDLMETGVWRGGAAIFLRAILAAYDDRTRSVWLADSFQGLPRPDADRYPADRDDPHWTYADLPVSLDEVKENFRRYGLLDDRVRFLPGWFRDTLPDAPVEQLAVLRLDGDMYESTIQALDALYPKLSVGGYLIVDDYGAIPACRSAVDDYRSAHGVDEPLQEIDWTGVFWQRAR